MNRLALASLCILIIAFCGCAATASFTQTGERYPSFEGPVRVYFEVPEFEYEQVGIVSSQGGTAHSRAEMIGAMQEKAAEYGANAIIIISEKTKENLTFAAGEFGAVGGTTASKNASALAVRVSSDKSPSGDSQLEKPEPRPAETFSVGASVNALPFVLSGYGGRIWAGKERFRAVGEVYNLDIPSAFLREGPRNGRIEPAYRLTGQYFTHDDLAGPFLSGGIEYTTTDVGYEGTVNRTSYDSFYFSGGIGYVFRFNRHFYLDTGLSLNVRWGSEEICVPGGGCFTPDPVTPIGFVGVGVNL